MNIKSFLESAKILYDNNKYDEALTLVCISVDACASKKYESKYNGEKYKKYLRDNFSIICKYGFPGIQASCIKIRNIKNVKLITDDKGFVGVEDIIYHLIRCGLVHECNIDETIELTEKTEIGSDNNKFFIPKDIILGLIASVESNIN